jgi:hypothetical protein
METQVVDYDAVKAGCIRALDEYFSVKKEISAGLKLAPETIADLIKNGIQPESLMPKVPEHLAQKSATAKDTIIKALALGKVATRTARPDSEKDTFANAMGINTLTDAQALVMKKLSSGARQVTPDKVKYNKFYDGKLTVAVLTPEGTWKEASGVTVGSLVWEIKEVAAFGHKRTKEERAKEKPTGAVVTAS